MRTTTIVAILLAVLLASTASGFDGRRQGFVLGGGLGFAPAAKWSVNRVWGSHTSDFYDETKAGAGINLLIGYAWDEKNMIVYEVNAVGFSSDLFDGSAAQGFDGAAWYHYFGQPGKSPFTVGGLGLYSFDVDYKDRFDPRLGVLLGGGYEFARHWQVGGYLSFGTTSSRDLGCDHISFSVLVSGVLF